MFATTGGFAGLIIGLGLLATILMIRVSIALPRRSLMRESKSASEDDIEVPRGRIQNLRAAPFLTSFETPAAAQAALDERGIDLG